MMYIKLKAQKMLIGKGKEAFFVSVLPFFMSASLLCFNYYLLEFIKNDTELHLIFKISIALFSGVVSLFLVNTVAFMSENYFYRRSSNSFVPVGAADVFCSFAVLILKTLLFFSWSAILFSPGAVLAFCAYFANANGYTREITVTLAVSAGVIALVGAVCFFVLFGRYSKCSFIQFTAGETNPVKVLARSSELMEENQIKYALFRLSFLGWDLLCLLLFPIIYVLPYRKCSKYVFFSEKQRKKQPEFLNDKPIVFIFG